MKAPNQQDSPIPNNWIWVNLGSFVEILSGYAFKSTFFTDDKEDMPLIRIRDVVRGYTETYTTEPYDEKYLIHTGDILIGMDGDFNIATWKSKSALLNQRVCKISSKTVMMLEKYFFYYLPQALKEINDVTSSTTVKHLSVKKIEGIAIPLPPLPEQQRIVDRIESLFEKLDQAKELVQIALDQFEERKAAIFHKAFTGELTREWRSQDANATNLPSTWKLLELKNVATWGSGGTPSRRNPQYYTGDILWIKTGELNDNVIYDSEEKITVDAIKNSSAKLFPANTILIAMYGATIGKCAILGMEASTNQACAAAIPNHLIQNKYLFYYLVSQKKEFVKKAKGGAQPNISQEIIKEHIIPLPPINEQEKIIEIIEKVLPLENETKDLIDVVDKVDLLKKSILARAFRGELGTNDPKEEQINI